MNLFRTIASINISPDQKKLFDEAIMLASKRRGLRKSLTEYDTLTLASPSQPYGMLAVGYSERIDEYKKEATDLRNRAKEAGISKWRIALVFPSPDATF